MLCLERCVSMLWGSSLQSMLATSHANVHHFAKLVLGCFRLVSRLRNALPPSSRGVDGSGIGEEEVRNSNTKLDAAPVSFAQNASDGSVSGTVRAGFVCTVSGRMSSLIAHSPKMT